MSEWSSSTVAYAFILCGRPKVRLDQIESYTHETNQFDGKESVDVRALSGRAYTFTGTLTEFEDLLRRAVNIASP